MYKTLSLVAVGHLLLAGTVAQAMYVEGQDPIELGDGDMRIMTLSAEVDTATEVMPIRADEGNNPEWMYMTASPSPEVMVTTTSNQDENTDGLGSKIARLFSQIFDALFGGRGEIVTMNVESETQPCTGVGPTDCMVINGEYFYSSIEGFEFEPGYEYELKVRKIERENPPADASAYEYRLVKIVSKTAVDTDGALLPQGGDMAAGSRLAPIYAYRWQWEENRTNGGATTEVPNPSEFELTFAGNGSFSSTSDCNNMFGSYTLENGTELSFGPIGATKMACPGNSLEQEYSSTLALVDRMEITSWDYETNDGTPRLHLYHDNGEMVFVGVAIDMDTANGALY